MFSTAVCTIPGDAHTLDIINFGFLTSLVRITKFIRSLCENLLIWDQLQGLAGQLCFFFFFHWRNCSQVWTDKVVIEHTHTTQKGLYRSRTTVASDLSGTWSPPVWPEEVMSGPTPTRSSRPVVFFSPCIMLLPHDQLNWIIAWMSGYTGARIKVVSEGIWNIEKCSLYHMHL